MKRRSTALAAIAMSGLARAALCDSDEARVAWLKATAAPLATIDPASASLDDLEPLRAMVGDARVAMLGEAWRGDGTAFLAKARLVRFLHERMDFDVLVFESGFYDCARAWDAIRSGADPRTALGDVLFPQYTQAAQFRPVLELVAARAATERPLAVAGMDDQSAGGADGESLTRDLRAALSRHGVPVDEISGYPGLEAVLRDLSAERYATGQAPVPSRAERKRILDLLADLRRRLTPAREKQVLPAEIDRSFWIEVLENVETHALASWKLGRYAPGTPLSPELNTLRDRRMAANVIWLARARHPGRRLIIWSMTVHAARDLDRLRAGDAVVQRRFDEMSTVGDELSKELGSELFTLGVTAYGGSWGAPFRAPTPMLAPTRGSFEDLMGRTGLEAALVDLRRSAKGGEWLGRSLLARPISHKEVLGVWPRHLDALLFLQRMEPARRIDGRGDP